MRLPTRALEIFVAVFTFASIATARAQDAEFSKLVQQVQGEKPEFARRQEKLLAERYDLSDRPAKGTTMLLAKPVQEEVGVRLTSSYRSG